MASQGHREVTHEIETHAEVEGEVRLTAAREEGVGVGAGSKGGGAEPKGGKIKQEQRRTGEERREEKNERKNSESENDMLMAGGQGVRAGGRAGMDGDVTPAGEPTIPRTEDEAQNRAPGNL